MALSGCSLAASITTSQAYDPSDGVGVTLQDVVVHNLIVISEGKDQPAVIIGSITNPRNEAVTVTISAPGSSADPVSVKVDPRTTLRLGVGDDDALVETQSTVLPGLLANIVVTLNNGDYEALQVPVVDGTFEEYRGILDAIS